MGVAPAAPVPVSGVLLALGGAVVFSVNDMAIKFLSGDYPLHEVILVRGIIGLAFLMGVIWLTGGNFAQLRSRRPGRHLLRICVVLISNVTYFLGLAAMPLADAVALAFVAPVLITLLSAVLLGERIGPHRLTAVIIGLAGTVVLMRPGSGAFGVAGGLVLVSALCYALSQILARSMRDTESAVTLSAWLQVGFILSAALVGLAAGDGRFAGSSDPSLEFLLRSWIWPPLADWPFFLATGLAVGIGGLMMAQAYRTLEAAVVAPFEYAAIPMAILWGVLIFGTLPDRVGLFGMAMIVLAGLYTLWRETLRRRHG